MIEEKVIGIAIQALVKEIIEESKTLFKGVESEVEQLFSRDLKKYINRQKDKFSNIKTLLHGSFPVYIYDIYYPVNLRNNQNKKIETKSIEEIFKINNAITIIGEAGSGKSTLIKHFFLCTIDEKIGIPILVELRNFNESSLDLLTHVKGIITENEISKSEEILERLLEKGKFVFFLDGFDELNSSEKDRVAKSINSLATRYSKNRFILTSRPYNHAESFPAFHNFKMSDFEIEDIKKFIRKQIKNVEYANKIIESVEGISNYQILSFLKNPLLLTLYIMVYQVSPEIPDKKYIFYRRVIQTLFSEHDSKTKLGYIREKTSNLTQEEFEEVLKSFSFLSFFENKVSFDIDYVNEKIKLIKKKKSIKFDTNQFVKDLKRAICLWVEDGNILTFSHRSLQEFYAALFVKDLEPENKVSLYSKIADLVIDKKLNSSSIFISVCKEMDEIGFYRYFSIPTLKKLIAIFEIKDTKERIKKVVLLYLDKIQYLIGEQTYWSSHHIPIFDVLDITFDQRRFFSDSIYLQEVEFVKALNKLQKSFDPPYFETHPNLVYETDEIVYVDLPANFDQLADIYIKYNMEQDIDKLKLILVKQLEKIEAIVRDNYSVDKELIDLI